LKTKFRQSAILYNNEKDKIDYIKDHCKNLIFDIIKARADPEIFYFYFIVDKIIQNLQNVFGERDEDRIENSKIKIHNDKFLQDEIEFFNRYYSRFVVVIISLRYNDQQKIRAIRHFFNPQLQNYMTDK
jgi:hypothetical protein